MIRFIDLRDQETGWRFALWNTQTDRFCEFGGEFGWDSVKDFKDAFFSDENSQDVERYIRVMPDWALVEPDAMTSTAAGAVETSPLDGKGSVGKHDWCVGDQCEDGFPVFVDDRQLAYRSTIEQGCDYALSIIDRLVTDGDYRLNDKPAGFLPPVLQGGPAASKTQSWFIEGGMVATVVCTSLITAGAEFKCSPAGNGNTVMGREQWFEFALAPDLAEKLRPLIAYDVPQYPSSEDTIRRAQEGAAAESRARERPRG